MPSNPQELTGGAFRRRMALFYASIFVALGVQLPFLPVWLAAKGLDAADHRRRAGAADDSAAVRHSDGDAGGRPPRRAAGGDHGRRAGGAGRASARSASLTARSRSPWSMRWRRPPSCRCSCCPTSMRCAALAPHRRAYGPVRLWGSAAFIVATLARRLAARFHRRPRPDLADRRRHGALRGGGLDAAAARRAPRGRACGATPPRAILLRDPVVHRGRRGREPDPGQPRALLQLLDHRLAGGRLRRRHHRRVVGAGRAGRDRAVRAVGAAAGGVHPERPDPDRRARARWCAGSRWRSTRPARCLPLLQCLHGLSFGATHLGTLAFIARAAPAGLAATAQGYLAVSWALRWRRATGLSGLLYGRFGAAAYGAMALIAARRRLAARVRRASDLQTAERR